jgi:hypothetical protein
MICYLISQSSWPSLLLIIINPCPRWSPPAWITLQIPTTNWDVMYMYDPKLHKLWTSFIIIYHQYDLDHHLSSFVIIYLHLSSICQYDLDHHLTSFIIIYSHLSSFIINIILMMLDLQDIGYQPPVGSPPKGGAPCQGSPKWTKRLLLAVSSNPGPRGIEGRQVQGLFMGYDYGNGIFH